MPPLAKQLQAVPDLEVRLNEPMSQHTTFRIGGPADVLCIPSSLSALRAALEMVAASGAPLTVMGSGTNLLVRDGGVRGVVLKIGEHLARIELRRPDQSSDADGVRAEAGAKLSAVARFAARHDLTGLEFGVGIPGSIGGAVVMNAGAYGGEMAHVVARVETFDRLGTEHAYEAADLEFSYRHSALAGREEIVARVGLRLSPGDGAAITARMSEFARRRQETQPLSLPSAGSVFRRPPGDYAGRLIEAAGLKGQIVGGAQVSEMHAGFIVNLGGATARDVLTLIAQVRDAVRRESGIELEPEIRVIGED